MLDPGGPLKYLILVSVWVISHNQSACHDTYVTFTITKKSMLQTCSVKGPHTISPILATALCPTCVQNQARDRTMDTKLSNREMVDRKFQDSDWVNMAYVLGATGSINSAEFELFLLEK